MNERTVNMLREITTAVNRGGMDTALDMPDYVIAGYLYRCLMALKLSKEETQTFFKRPEEWTTPTGTTSDK